MILSYAYRNAPTFLQNAAVSGFGTYLRWQRNGGEFDALLGEAMDATFASAGEARALRERVWAERGLPAIESTPRYGRRIELAHLAELPIITKADVRSDPSLFANPRVPRWTSIALHTSGTTGAGLHLASTRYAVRRMHAFAWRFRRWHGIPRDEWCAMLTGRSVVPAGQRGAPFWRTNAGGRSIMFSQYHLGPRTVREYVEQLRRARLRWIHGYPSFVALLARLAVDAGLAGRTGVRWVTLSSETLRDDQRRAIAEMFGVEPVQQYGSVESVAMISECPAHRLHVDEDYSVVEFVPRDGNGGACRIVGSAIDNEAFPLLRYDSGDTATPSPEASCSCGRAGRLVAHIDGRVEDLVELSDGCRVGRLDHLLKDAVHVAEAQVVQRRRGEITILVVRGEGYTPADEASILQEVEDRFGDRLSARIEYVERIPRTSGGKLRFVVSELPDSGATA